MDEVGFVKTFRE